MAQSSIATSSAKILQLGHTYIQLADTLSPDSLIKSFAVKDVLDHDTSENDRTWVALDAYATAIKFAADFYDPRDQGDLIEVAPILRSYGRGLLLQADAGKIIWPAATNTRVELRTRTKSIKRLLGCMYSFAYDLSHQPHFIGPNDTQGAIDDLMEMAGCGHVHTEDLDVLLPYLQIIHTHVYSLNGAIADGEEDALKHAGDASHYVYLAATILSERLSMLKMQRIEKDARYQPF